MLCSSRGIIHGPRNTDVRQNILVLTFIKASKQKGGHFLGDVLLTGKFDDPNTVFHKAEEEVIQGVFIPS